MIYMKKLCLLLGTALLLFITGCTSSITLTLNKNGSVTAEFSGTPGKGFKELLKASVDSKDAENKEVVFDTKAIKKELEKGGFTDVKASSQTGTDIYIKMTDPSRKSEYFTSGLVNVKKNKLKVVLSPANLKKFYESTDEQTVSYLDMLLSPVFNSDTMSEKEYIELVSSFYGKDVASEIEQSSVSLTIVNPDGKKSTHKIKMSRLLTLNETLQLE